VTWMRRTSRSVGGAAVSRFRMSTTIVRAGQTSSWRVKGLDADDPVVRDEAIQAFVA
jgi:hypothetical protein